MSSDYVPPEYREDGFNCPNCGAYAEQEWRSLFFGDTGMGDYSVARCSRCRDYSIWKNGMLVFPKDPTAPRPNEDMPDEVKQDFSEARNVVDDSPRAAAALLRLAIEKLADELGADEDQYLNDMIGELYEEGVIDESVKQALDSVRVYGNESVHPGEIDMQDNRETAMALFQLVNIIVRQTISEKRAIREVYETLPESKRDGIENRDAS